MPRRAKSAQNEPRFARTHWLAMRIERIARDDTPPLTQPPQNLRRLPPQPHPRDVDIEDGGAFILALAFHQLGAAMAAEARRDCGHAGALGAGAVARQLNDVG